MKPERIRSVSLKTYLLTVLLVALICIGTTSYVFSQNSSQTITIEPASFTETASYVIENRSSTIYAKNGTTGEIEFTGADIATVLQNIMNVASNGVDIFIKKGIYRYSSPITINEENIELIGEGFQTKLLYDGSDVAVRVKKSDGSSLYRYYIANLYIEAPNGNGIELYNCHWGEVKGCYVYCCNTGIYCYGAWESYLTYNVIRYCQIGIKLSGETGKSCNHIRILGNYLGNNLNIEIDDTGQPAGIKIEGNDIADSTIAGIKVTKRTRMLTIERNYFENNDGYCIHLAGEAGALIRGTVISRNFFGLNEGKIAIYADYCEGTWIEANWCEGGSYFVYMTPNAIRLTGLINKLYTPNYLTDEAVWKSDYFTETVIYIPIIGELLNVTETTYTYKYYLFKLDTTKFEKIYEARLEVAMKAATGQTVYIKLVKYDGGWLDVSGSEVSWNQDAWALVQSGDIKNSLYDGETDYMVMVKTTGGTSQIQRAALKLVVRRG